MFVKDIIMTENTEHNQPLFSTLVYDEAGQQVDSTFVGSEPHYVILDGDFKRHVAAEVIDQQVVNWLQNQVSANKELVSEGVMNMIGQDDLFTKAMIDASIGNLNQAVRQQGLPNDAKMMLGMMGFKIIVNVHGELVDLEMPANGVLGDDEEDL
jgi:hypothetical protein